MVTSQTSHEDKGRGRSVRKDEAQRDEKFASGCGEKGKEFGKS